ncbi:MAG: cell wall hydrolase [Lachnospiraceae bacterium]|jgi:N-acetylmuramoyl-L-alanine amidase|nr:cell wall hydrolase [Lachnospiraceae bacterium]
MLAIHNLLRNIACLFRNISKKTVQNCAVLISGFSVFVLVSLQAQGARSVGKHAGTAEGGQTAMQEEACEAMAGAAGEEAGTQENLLAAKREGKGEGFVSSCQRMLERGQSVALAARISQGQEEETVAACASIQPMYNEMRPEPANPYGDISITEKDYEALLRIVEAEAGGEDPQGRTLVAEVILNRVLADQFASTIYEVVFERTGGSPQFAPTADGRYYTVEVMPETVKAVERAIHEEDLSQGALFFSARSKAEENDMAWFDRNLKWLFQYGGHEFYTLP